MVEFPVPVKPVYSSPTCWPVLTVSVPPVVVAGTVKKYTASKIPSSSLAALVEEKTELFERPSTGDPPLGREGQLGAGHRVEAREEVARVRLAVGDVGIGGLEAEDQIRLIGALRRLKRLARSEVAERCAGDLCIVASM